VAILALVCAWSLAHDACIVQWVPAVVCIAVAPSTFIATVPSENRAGCLWGLTAHAVAFVGMWHYLCVAIQAGCLFGLAAQEFQAGCL